MRIARWVPHGFVQQGAIATHDHSRVDADKATDTVGKGFGKAKNKVSRHKHAPADEDPTDDNTIVIHQEPDDQSNQKHRGDKVGPALRAGNTTEVPARCMLNYHSISLCLAPHPSGKAELQSAASSIAHQGSAAPTNLSQS